MLIAICDDDSKFLEHLHGVLQKKFEELKGCCQEEIKVLHYHKKEEILERYFQDKIDIVLMDIEFGNDIGFDVARELFQIDSNLLIVYMTNHDHYVYESFVCRPMGFVRKSNIDTDLEIALNHVMEEFNRRYKTITVPMKKETFTIYLQKIYAIEMYDHYMEIVLQDDSIKLNATMKRIEKELQENGFVKVRRGVAVNGSYILNIKQDIAFLKNGKQYPISRNQMKEVRHQWLISKMT